MHLLDSPQRDAAIFFNRRRVVGNCGWSVTWRRGRGVSHASPLEWEAHRPPRRHMMKVSSPTRGRDSCRGKHARRASACENTQRHGAIGLLSALWGLLGLLRPPGASGGPRGLGGLSGPRSAAKCSLWALSDALSFWPLVARSRPHGTTDPWAGELRLPGKPLPGELPRAVKPKPVELLLHFKAMP